MPEFRASFLAGNANKGESPLLLLRRHSENNGRSSLSR
jgi:hypothetical protein